MSKATLGLLLALTMVAVACAPSTTGPSGSAPAGTGATATQAAPQPGGRLVIGQPAEPQTMSTLYSISDYGGLRAIYRGLTKTNSKTGADDPDLAEKFEMSKDGL